MDKLVYIAKITNEMFESFALKERVSFDVGTLNRNSIQKLIKEMNESGKYEIYVLSESNTTSGTLVYPMLLNIPIANVYATGGQEGKIKKIRALNIKQHYDTNPEVVNKIIGIGKLV